MNEYEILQSAAALCDKAAHDLQPRFGVEPVGSPQEDFDQMMAEHLAHKDEVDAALAEWLHSHIFSGRLAEPVLRQCFLRVLGAFQLLHVARGSLISERPPQDRTPEGVLRYLLVATWSDTTAPETWFRRLSRHETLAHATIDV